MKQRKVAQHIFQYRRIHGIEDDATGDWFKAGQFLADSFWVDEVKKARIWESRNKVAPSERVDERLLVWRWLDSIVYGHDGSDPIKPRGIMEIMFSVSIQQVYSFLKAFWSQVVNNFRW